MNLVKSLFLIILLGIIWPILLIVLVTVETVLLPYRLYLYVKIKRSIPIKSNSTLLLYSSQGKWSHFLENNRELLIDLILIDVKNNHQTLKNIANFIKIDTSKFTGLKEGRDVALIQFKPLLFMRSIWSIYKKRIANCYIISKSEKKLMNKIRDINKSK